MKVMVLLVDGSTNLYEADNIFSTISNDSIYFSFIYEGGEFSTGFDRVLFYRLKDTIVIQELTYNQYPKIAEYVGRGKPQRYIFDDYHKDEE